VVAEGAIFFRLPHDTIPVDVPFAVRDGRIWIPIRINGEVAQAIFDTGSDGTAIDADLAARLGLRTQEGPKGSTVAGEIQLQKTGSVEFEVAQHRLAAEEVVILPLAAQMPGLQAILGFDVLRDMPFAVDYGKSRIQLDTLPSGEGVPFVVDGDMRPTAWLETLGGRFQAHLDTGSSRGVSLPLEWVKANAPELLKGETHREILGDLITAREFTVDKVLLGGLELEGVPGEAVSAEGGSFAAQQSHWANVGNELLKRFRLGIDGRRRESIFQLIK
jgi:hypothetical protein